MLLVSGTGATLGVKFSRLNVHERVMLPLEYSERYKYIRAKLATDVR